MKTTTRQQNRASRFSSRLRPLAYVMTLAFSAGSGAALAADAPPGAFSLAQEPITSGDGVSPNLLYIHDNSGSMYFSFMPDLERMPGRPEAFVTQSSNYKGYVCSGVASFTCPSGLPKLEQKQSEQLRSPEVNKIYYDPDVTYPPPPAPPNVPVIGANGSLVTDGTLGNANFNNAWFDGYDIDGRNSSGDYITEGNDTVPRRVNLGTKYKATYHFAELMHLRANGYYNNYR
ncbi:MAG: hypothetical protein LBE06_04150, partial [Azoarcus sp.]|nr:hypothetical protein [Azoarcus sp.]